MGKNGSNIFTHTAGVLAHEGFHPAVNVTVTSTEYIGKTRTKYGLKDFQMFYIQVKQLKPDGGYEIAEIHQQFHRSFNPQSSLTKFLAGFGFKAQPGMTFDFDDLVGKHAGIVVMHFKDAGGVVHANITMPPRCTASALKGGAQ